MAERHLENSSAKSLSVTLSLIVWLHFLLVLGDASPHFTPMTYASSGQGFASKRAMQPKGWCFEFTQQEMCDSRRVAPCSSSIFLMTSL